MNGIIGYRLKLKKGPGDCIRIDKVAAALKKISHKAPGLSELVAKMIQATEVLEFSGYWIYVMIL